MSLAQNIKYYRQKKNLTQEKLASLLGVSSQAVSKWETCETYPDGALLVPLAQHLEVSLDTLFDNDTVHLRELSEQIMRFIHESPEEERCEMLHRLTLYFQKGLYISDLKEESEYDPQEYQSRRLHSHIVAKDGFSWYAAGEHSFYALFPQGANGYEAVVQGQPYLQRIFSLLASPDVLNALIAIHRHNDRYVFEKEVLAKECGIEDRRMDEVMEALLELQAVRKNEIELNGQKRVLYYAQPNLKWVSLLIIACATDYRGARMMTGVLRRIPFFQPKN